MLISFTDNFLHSEKKFTVESLVLGNGKNVTGVRITDGLPQEAVNFA